MAKQDERFIKVLNEGSTWTTNREIWVDKTTGVNYLWILIAEIQQNSNTTYRVYDYGRVGADGKPLVTRIPTEEE